MDLQFAEDSSVLFAFSPLILYTEKDIKSLLSGSAKEVNANEI